ncbi:MAG: hypothetical protein ABI806_05525 [Candidatus Solibacter sp.]
MEEGLAARVHDPLWLLARQCQLGEFNAKDAGTPVVVEVHGSSSPVNAWRGLDQVDWTPFDGSVDPLDALVESEEESEPSLRERVEAGAHFLRLLTARGLGALKAAFVSAHPFNLAEFAADALFAAIAKRTPDGLLLLDTALALIEGAPQPVAVDPADLESLVAASSEWLVWYQEEIFSTAGTGAAVTWQEHRMEYGFAVSSPAGEGTVLVADRYPGDGLEWFDFDIDPNADANPGPAPIPIHVTAVPHPVRFAGMPLPRFWAMEDARVDFGSIDAAPNDVGRLLLVQFGTVYGNDWFVLPLKIPTGTLSILDNVTVKDVFGRTFVLGKAGLNEPGWNMFSLDLRGKANPAGRQIPALNGLLLPPTPAYSMESAPVETVLFLRDEMADLAWGVEAQVQNPLEGIVDRRAAWIAPGKLPPGTRDLSAYRVETVVPDYWIPLAPEHFNDPASVRLRMTPMELDNGGVPTAVEPKGRLLESRDSGGRLWVFDEEIPREGTQIDRIYRYARWRDGRTSMWTARRRRVGRGEGSSGLRFDVLDPG